MIHKQYRTIGDVLDEMSEEDKQKVVKEWLRVPMLVRTGDVARNVILRSLRDDNQVEYFYTDPQFYASECSLDEAVGSIVARLNPPYRVKQPQQWSDFF